MLGHGPSGVGQSEGGDLSHEAAGSPPALGLAVRVVFAIAGVVMAQVLPVSVWGGRVCEGGNLMKRGTASSLSARGGGLMSRGVNNTFLPPPRTQDNEKT